MGCPGQFRGRSVSVPPGKWASPLAVQGGGLSSNLHTHSFHPLLEEQQEQVMSTDVPCSAPARLGSCSIQSFLSNPRRPGKGSGSRSPQRGLPQAFVLLTLPPSSPLHPCAGTLWWLTAARAAGMKVSLVGPGDRWTEVGGTAQPSPQPLQLSLSSFIHQILFKHLLCTRLCHEGHRGCGPHHGDPSFRTLFLARRPGDGPPNLDPLISLPLEQAGLSGA